MDDRPNDERFPGNSYSNISAKKKDEKTVEKVATGRVIQKKKTLREKFSETFMSTDGHSVTEYVIFDVLIPSVKDAISEIVGGALNMMLFGDRKGRHTERRNGQSVVYTSYENYYNNRNRSDDRRDQGPRSRANVEDIVFNTRLDAEEVLSNMIDRINEYGVVTVKALYEFADLKSNYTMDSYGWYNLNNATVDRVQGGYLLKLPKPVVID
jgi:hypothetical protein